MPESFDNSSLLTILRRKKETIENVIRVLEEYQKLVGATDSRPPFPSELNDARVVELLLQRDLFPRD
jgi:hypothetical protein